MYTAAEQETIQACTGPVSGWLSNHVLFTYVFILICLIYVFNTVFRMQKLPILKDVIIYLLLGFGAFLLLFFQVDACLPIVPSFAVAIALMATVKIRYWMLAKEQRKKDQTSAPTGEE